MTDENIDSNELDSCGDLGGDDKISAKRKIVDRSPAERKADEMATRKRGWEKFVDKMTKDEPSDLVAFRDELEERVRVLLERDDKDWDTYNKLREEGRTQEARKFVFWWEERKQQRKQQAEQEEQKVSTKAPSELTPVLTDDNN